MIIAQKRFQLSGEASYKHREGQKKEFKSKLSRECLDNPERQIGAPEVYGRKKAEVRAKKGRSECVAEETSKGTTQLFLIRHKCAQIPGTATCHHVRKSNNNLKNMLGFVVLLEAWT
jgi:hypothetical protein